MIEVYAVKITKQIEKSVFNRCLAYLHKDKQVKIMKFYKYEDAQRSLISDILIRTLICEKTQISNKDIIFDTNEYGKPFLKKFSNFKFNISHSCEWIVCAIYNHSVGIDIEKIAPIDFDVAKQFYSKTEYNALLSKDPGEAISFFYDIWTLKESYIKAAGKGLSIPLDSFSISINDDTIDLITENPFKNCFFKQYNIDNNYKMAVCSSINNFCNEIKYKNIEQLLEGIAVI